jgi:hypothetical protein
MSRERREDPRKSSRQHRLPGARRPGEQEVVSARGGDLERTPCSLLSPYFGQVGDGLRLERVLFQRLEGRRVDLAPQVGDCFGEMANGYRLHAGERRLGRRLGRTDDPPQTRAPRAFRNRQRSGHGPDAAVEGELADRHVLGEPFRWQLSSRSKNREGDR